MEEDDLTKRYVVDSLGRMNHTLFINESGLYALILGSKLEAARSHRTDGRRSLPKINSTRRQIDR